MCKSAEAEIIRAPFAVAIGAAKPHGPALIFIVNKNAIIREIIAALAAELASYTHSARIAFAAATDEQSKAENKYDTRALEASYLARGQSLQAAEIQQAIAQFEAMPVREFRAGAPVDVGALVALEGKGGMTHYFIGPRGGGTEVNYEGCEILVITPQSPMGSQLMGLKSGAKVKISVGRFTDTYTIASVQ